MNKLKSLIKECAYSSRQTKIFFLWTLVFLMMTVGYTFYTYVWLDQQSSGTAVTK